MQKSFALLLRLLRLPLLIFFQQTDFTPMLPGDDQLISYGLDSTVSIVRTNPSQLQQTKVATVELTKRVKEDGKDEVSGCSIKYNAEVFFARKKNKWEFSLEKTGKMGFINFFQKATKYVIKNNSDKVIEKFYIEHVADSAHGGYVITTKENSSKSVTGFSRFEFTIPAHHEVEFVVREVCFLYF